MPKSFFRPSFKRIQLLFLSFFEKLGVFYKKDFGIPGGTLCARRLFQLAAARISIIWRQRYCIGQPELSAKELLTIKELIAANPGLFEDNPGAATDVTFD